MPDDYSRSAGYEGKLWTTSYSNGTEEVHGKVLRKTTEDRGGSREDLEEYDLQAAAGSRSDPVKEVHDTKMVVHHDLHVDHGDNPVSLRDLRKMDRLGGESVQIGGRHSWDDCALTWI